MMARMTMTARTDPAVIMAIFFTGRPVGAGASTHNCQPGGGGGQEGSGCHPGGGVQPAGAGGHPGGALNCIAMKSLSNGLVGHRLSLAGHRR
jgi:hypothetical protein